MNLNEVVEDTADSATSSGGFALLPPSNGSPNFNIDNQGHLSTDLWLASPQSMRVNQYLSAN